MTPSEKLMDHFPLEWRSALRFGSKLHRRPICELAGAAFLAAAEGKTPGQFHSKIRRELKPKFGAEKLSAIAGEWRLFYQDKNSLDPLDLLIEKEEELAKHEEDKIILGEFNSTELALKLGISRRMAQIKIKKRKREIENKINGVNGAQLEFVFAGL